MPSRSTRADAHSWEARRHVHADESAAKVINGHAGDQNIGMQVIGNVYTNMMLFNVEGRSVHAAEMTHEQLIFRRDLLRRAVRLRRATLSGTKLVFWLAVAALWTQIPVAMSLVVPGPLSGGILAAVMAAGVALAMAVLYRLRRGNWAREQRETIQRLEARLAELEAEREMRRLDRPVGFLGTIREIASILRE